MTYEDARTKLNDAALAVVRSRSRGPHLDLYHAAGADWYTATQLDDAALQAEQEIQEAEVALELAKRRLAEARELLKEGVEAERVQALAESIINERP